MQKIELKIILFMKSKFKKFNINVQTVPIPTTCCLSSAQEPKSFLLLKFFSLIFIHCKHCNKTTIVTQICTMI